MTTGVSGLIALIKTLGEISLPESPNPAPMMTPIMCLLNEGFICIVAQIEVQQLTQNPTVGLLQDVRERLANFSEQIRIPLMPDQKEPAVQEFYESIEWLAHLLGHVAPEAQTAFVLASENWTRRQDQWTPTLS